MKDLVVVTGGDSDRSLLLKNKLDTDRYDVQVCSAYEEFIALSKERSIISIILLYPDVFKIVAKLYDQKVIDCFFGKIPVVFISSVQADNKRVRSLCYKADEFLIEPVSSCELSAIISDASRLAIHNDNRSALTIGDIVLDRLLLTVTVRNIKLHLCPVPVRILEILMLNPGRTFTRHEILNRIWSEDSTIDERTIDASIARIRDAIKHKVTDDPIRTVRSVGYAFSEYFGQTSSLPRKGRGMRRTERPQVCRRAN
jgi:DNA-binding response OmpR family regulator